MNYKERYRKMHDLAIGDYVPCLICHNQAVDLHHIVRKSRGGSDDVWNLAPLCRKHHNEVHQYKITEELLQGLNDERNKHLFPNKNLQNKPT